VQGRIGGLRKIGSDQNLLHANTGFDCAGCHDEPPEGAA
jgi:hypothetical protein